MYDTKYNVTFELGRGDYCIVRPRYHKWINVVTYDRGMHEMAWRPHTSSPRRDCEPRFIYSCGHWPKYWHAPCILRAATEPCGFICLHFVSPNFHRLFSSIISMLCPNMKWLALFKRKLWTIKYFRFYYWNNRKYLVTPRETPITAVLDKVMTPNFHRMCEI